MGFLPSNINQIKKAVVNHHLQNFQSGSKEAVVVRGPQGATLYTGGGNDLVSVKQNSDGSATVTVNGEKHEFTEAEAQTLTIDSGAGDDVVQVTGDLNIAIRGGGGDDFIRGGDGNENIDGGSGNDNIGGSDGNDVINGGAGGDFIDGGAGNDFINGGAGRDSMQGGAGDDTLIGKASSSIFTKDFYDRMDGGEGNDTIIDTNRFRPKGGSLLDAVKGIGISVWGGATSIFKSAGN